jgi:hypothetical protein
MQKGAYMNKTYAVLTGVVLAMLAFHACEFSIPTAIEIKAAPSMSLPVKPDSVNISKLLSDNVKAIFPEDGAFKVYAYSGYKHEGTPIQSFLLYYPVVENKELDLSQYLDKINNDVFSAAQTFPPQEIKIPEFDFSIPSITSNVVFFGANFAAPDFPGDKPKIGNDDDFETVEFGAGSQVELKVKLEGVAPPVLDSGVRLVLHNIKITINGTAIDASGDVTLNNADARTVTFDLTRAGAIPAGSEMHFSADFRDDSLPSAFGTTAKVTIDLGLKDITLASIGVDISKYNLSIPPINVPLHDAAEYVEWIDFDGYEDPNPTDGVGLKLRFDHADIPGMGIKVTCDDLKLPGEIKEIKQTNPDEFIMFKNSEAFTLEFDASTVLTLNVEMGALPYNTVTQKYETDNFRSDHILTIKNVSPGDTKRIEGSADMIRDWIAASVNVFGDNLSMKVGEYPDVGAGSPPLDMSTLNTYLDPGFKFKDIETKLILSGPPGFEDLKPKLKLDAKYGAGDNPKPLFEEQLSLDLPMAPLHHEGGDDDAPVDRMPTEGTDVSAAFDPVMNDRPEDLSFLYNVSLEEVVIRPAMFEGAQVTLLNVILVIMLPLHLQAGDSGAKINFPDAFKDKSDLFDRKESGDTSFLDMIKRLSLNIAMTDTVFSGGELFMSDGANHEFKFPLSGKSLQLSITGKDLDYINKTIPYKPDMGIRFGKDKTLQIPMGLGAVGVSFDAEIDYRLEL